MKSLKEADKNIAELEERKRNGENVDKKLNSERAKAKEAEEKLERIRKRAQEIIARMRHMVEKTSADRTRKN
jgi:ElaB/YqjD/DUF883 family membrane-anchored ribosome-binding protein